MDLGLRTGRFKKSFSQEMKEYVIKPKMDKQAESATEHFSIHRAHVVMLVRCQLITRECGAGLLAELAKMDSQRDWILDYRMDDFYAITEHLLISRLGDEVGGRLHIGRSRNDLDATAIRLKARLGVETLLEDLDTLIECLIELADLHRSTILPEYTHLQQAQAGTLAHYLLGFVSMLENDAARFEDALKRTNVSPLGSGAIGGTGFNIDRNLAASLLGFDTIVDNSLAGVSMRDFAIEILSASAMTGVDLSRAAEDLITWASVEFGMVDLGEEYSGTSSIMPQKKNPIALETVRSKAAFLQGQLMIGLTTLKATNLGHNWDCYEIDPALHASTSATIEMIRVLRGIFQTTTFNPERMLTNLSLGFSTVTELADALVRKTGLSFRAAHMVVGRLVSETIGRQGVVGDITSAETKRVISSLLGIEVQLSEEIVRAALDIKSNVEQRRSIGGPAEHAVNDELIGKRARLAARSEARAARHAKYQASSDRLDAEVLQILNHGS